MGTLIRCLRRSDLAGFDFSQYRVVILNWDDTFLS